MICLKKSKLLILTRYSILGASSRLRFYGYFPFLSNAGLSINSVSLISNFLLDKKYKNGFYELFPLIISYYKYFLYILRFRRSDIFWIEKELFPWLPLWIERLILLKKIYILDYDDAVFHKYDLHPNKILRHIFSKKLDKLMAGSALVVCGNNYLAERARLAGAKHVEIIPTVIDLNKYPHKAVLKKYSTEINPPLRIVWIGSPATQKYLQLLIEPLQALTKTHNFVIRFIGLKNFNIPGVICESVEWSEENEYADISRCDIGVMPLFNTPWERGKCGYKLIQYMACGLPVIASDVGVNSSIVSNGVNGFLVDDADGWINSLRILMDDDMKRSKMGALGRTYVEDQYNIQKKSIFFIELLKSL